MSAPGWIRDLYILIHSIDADEEQAERIVVNTLRKRGWKVTKLPEPVRELPGQTTVEEQIAEVE